MAGSPQFYIPRSLAGSMRKQAVRVWGVALALVSVWVLLILAAPVTAGTGLNGVSEPIYDFFGFLCHQQPERSFHLGEHAFAVCSRCFGVYFGLVAGMAAYPLLRKLENVEPMPRYWLFLSLFPMGVDWGLNALNIWHNTHISRFFTGLVLGIACAVFIVPAAIEIVRNASFRPRKTVRG